MKYLMLTDTPAPWREKVFESVHQRFGDHFIVAYCNHGEERRLWNFPLGRHTKKFFKSIRIKIRDNERNINLGIIPFLLKTRPEIIIWFGFQPTVILALLTSKLFKTKYAVLSDTWLVRDRDISWYQIATRKLAYNYFSDAFIGVSKQTLRMYQAYNRHVTPKDYFYSHLCADNQYFIEKLKNKTVDRKYDIMFSGRIVEIKNPSFFVDVAIKLKKRLGRCRVLIIGDGPETLKHDMFCRLDGHEVEYTFAGFIKHKDLPNYYSQAKLLLFPTSGDCWGVVINEAMVSGTPVVTTEMTAAAGELVIHTENGLVLPMDADIWADNIAPLLKDDHLWQLFSKQAQQTVNYFSFDRAAEGLIAAINHLESK